MTTGSCSFCDFLRDECSPQDREDLYRFSQRESADTLVTALTHWKGRHVVGASTIKKHIRESHSWFIDDEFC